MPRLNSARHFVRHTKRDVTSQEVQDSKEATRKIQRYEHKDRACMRCRAEFLSTGPHHRMCDDCRRTTADEGMI